MIQKLKDLLGFGPKVNYTELIANGAAIIDVRTRGEYSSGHVNGSVNIPLDQIESAVKKFKNKDNPIITCCASGIRSASAKTYLKNKGFTNVHNGGSWYNVNKHVD